MIVYLARDIPVFVMYCVNGESGSSLLIQSYGIQERKKKNLLTKIRDAAAKRTDTRRVGISNMR